MFSSILQLLAALSILVIFHEFGHFIVARLFKIRVEKFYLFFNPWFSLFKFKPKNSETEYGIGWLPLGGYVKIAGMIDESFDTEQMKKPAEKWEFRSHPAWQRLLVMVAGVVFNFVMAILIYAFIAFHWGEEYIPLNQVSTGMEYSSTAKAVGFQDGDILYSVDGELLDMGFGDASIRKIFDGKNVTVLRGSDTVVIGMPADFMQRMLREKQGFAYYRMPFVVDSVMTGSFGAKAGMMTDDRLLAINDTTVFISDALKMISDHKNQALNFQVLRGADTLNLTVTPNAQGKIGVYMKSLDNFFPVKRVEYGFLESIPAGISKGVKKLTGYAGDMKYVFTKEGAENMGGFIAIMGLFPSPFNAQAFLEVLAFLSVILAFMNILPIPVLDGGHVMFLLYELITRRKPSQKFMERAMMIGMAFLFCLLIYANTNDVVRLFLSHFSN
ncbi:MAG TPA: RIP metalloprotease RseP [Paludibacteraceae bacterium]|nr:RIP metalloprotease RseP [Paludibacteraceae bacterium]